MPPRPRDDSTPEEREKERLKGMNSLQWLAKQAEGLLEAGLDTCVASPSSSLRLHRPCSALTGAPPARRVLGPPTEGALRPAAVRETSERTTHERVVKRARKRLNAAEAPPDPRSSDLDAGAQKMLSVRGPPGCAQRPTSPASLLRAHPQEFEKQAAIKRRALELLDMQREEDEWCVPLARSHCLATNPVLAGRRR